jgi:putative salt-induced outer membrane protein YdiY
MRHVIIAAVVCVLLCQAGVWADEVYFKNGDRLSGEIVRLADGKLLFQSRVAGEVSVNLSEVQTLSSDAPIEVHLADGTVLHQPVTVAEPNQFAIERGEALRAQTFELANVVSINPAAKPTPKWTGSISGSLTSSHGNTKADSMAGSVNVARRSEKDRTTGSADYARREQEDPDTGIENTTENWWRAKAQYDYFFSKKFFGFLNGRYEKDAIAMLDRRVVVGGGAGYQWIEAEQTNFSTSLGLASLYEKFDNATDSNSEISAQAGYNFDTILWKNLKFLHDLTYYPSLGQFSDYYLTTTAELRATMIKNLFASFKVIFDYDASPAMGQGSTDVKYLFGVGLEF